MVQKAPKLLELDEFQKSDLKRLSNALRVGARVEFCGNQHSISLTDMEWIGPMIDGMEKTDDVVRQHWKEWQAPPRSSDKGPGVTVVIPTHRQVPVGLSAWLNQDLPVRVLILSNGPRGPKTAESAQVVRLPWRGHGATRQAAVSMVRDDYLLFAVDDALPLGAGFVRRLVESLETPLEGHTWDAMVARQVPWPDADPITIERVRQWTPAARSVYRMPQSDHVCTLYRTGDLMETPLPAVTIAEDAWWSVDRNIGCDPSAPIVHSHPRKPRQLYRRNRDIHRERVRMGLTPTVANVAQLLCSMPSAFRPIRRGQPIEVLNQLAELCGQYRGGQLGHVSVG